MSVADLATCVSEDCTLNGHTYKFYYTGEVFQDNVYMHNWSDEQTAQYERDRPELLKTCDFRCPLSDGRASVIDIRIDSDVDVKISLQEELVRGSADQSDTSISRLNAWYLSPESRDSINWQRFMHNKQNVKKLQVDQQVCAYSAPLIGKSMTSIFVGNFASFSYLGLAQSGIFCSAPVQVSKFHYSPQNNVDYSCPVEDLTHDYPNWHRKWYSPLCRPWYKEAKRQKSHNTLSDLYIQASADYFGITPCAPILRQPDLELELEAGSTIEDEDFYGAVCYDIDPSGSLKEYFEIDADNQPTHLLFNSDENFESMSRIIDSQFVNFAEQTIGAKIVKSKKLQSATIESISVTN